MDGWATPQWFASLRSVALACLLSRRDGRTTRRLDSAYGGAQPCLRACVRACVRLIYIRVRLEPDPSGSQIANYQAKLGFRSLYATLFGFL
jgi:hypothetical protein